jgi:hypothetical protein
VHISAAPTGCISVKFDIGDVDENLLKKNQNLIKIRKNIRDLT